MAQTVYECLYLFDANKYARDAQGVADTANGLIEKVGGEILASRLWRDDKLAYPIKGHKRGAYWLTYFRSEGEKISQFNRECEINDDVLRHMVIKIEPRLVEALVANARGEALAPAEESEESKPVAAGAGSEPSAVSS